MRNNIIANYLAQAYIALAAIISTPWLVARLGVEVFGLVSFFLSLQAVFSLLDAGLSGTVSRECAVRRVDPATGRSLAGILVTIERFFLAISLLGLVLIILVSPYLAEHWFKPRNLTAAGIFHDLQLIALMLAARLMSGLHRSVLVGFERQVQLSASNIAMTSLRYFAVFPVLEMAGTSDHVYFEYQAIVSVLELLTLKLLSMRASKLRLADHLRLELPRNLGQLIGFSAQLSVLSLCWVILTQTDKLVLSKSLPLADFGILGVATTLASGLLLLSGPLTTAAMPRIASAHAAGQLDEVERLYFQVTRLLIAVMLPCVLVMAVYPDHVLLAWTRDPALATPAAPILRWYAIANALLVGSGLPFLLQYAKGSLALNIRLNIIYLAVFVPVVVLVALNFSAVEVGRSLVALNGLYFLIGVAHIHAAMPIGFHRRWLRDAVLAPLFFCLPVTVLLQLFRFVPESRMHSLFLIAGYGLLLLASLFAHNFWRIRRGECL